METYEGEFKKIIERLIEYREPVERLKERVLQVSSKIKGQTEGISEYLSEVSPWLSV